MCGFVGYINKNNNIKNEDIIEKMADRIKHRGPDDASYYTDDFISLGFRRLSIIDLDGGRQPILNEDESKVLVFNGEIYNYQEIRKDLKKKHKFKTDTDSEVILHGYEEYGTDIVNKLRGMFAFIIYDKNTKEVFGARDYFGIKPFYYYTGENNFMFSSEIKSFLEHPDFKKELNLDALESYLSYQYSSLEESFFKNVFKLTPGHYFKYADGKMDITRYFDYEFDYDDSKTLDEWSEEIKKVMADSVAKHKISDVEVGSFLSSGIDSSYIATIADVDKTFTVGFDNGEKYNEISYAKELSEMIGVKHITKIISPEEFFDNFGKIQYHMDEPVADASLAALYFLCNLASKHVKVVLSGEGADELFTGYNVYREPIEYPQYKKYVPYFIRRIVSKFFGLFPEHRGINFFVRKGQKVEEKFIGNAKIFSTKERRRLLTVKTNAPSEFDLVKPLYEKQDGMDEVSKMQYVDINMWLVGDILQKADKMSMANSLEVRVPFLDKEVMEVARKIPIKYKLREGTTKYALRKAASEVLPDKWSKKKKLGFPVPIRVWMKEDKYYNLILEEFTSDNACEFFNTKKLVKLLEEHKKGKKDNSRKIWTVYTFLRWYKEYFC